MNVVLNTISRTDIIWSLSTIDEATDPFVLKTEI